MTLNKQIGKKIKLFCVIGLIIILCFFLKLIIGRNITSVQEYQELIKKFGVAGPVILTLFQALQVVIPILPGYLGCAAGAVSFGTVVGFVCNYIGISAGSVIAYFLAQKYGTDFVESLFSERQYQKWKKKIEGKSSYDVFLFLAMLLPLFPDDLLCYVSGLMKMNKKRFIWIVILGKPWCILAYSILFGLIG